MRGRFILLLIMLAGSVRAQKDFTDTLSTSQGDLVILVPYHYDDGDITPLLLDILKDIPGLEVWTGESEMPSGYKNCIPVPDLLIRPNPVHDFLLTDELANHSAAFLYDMSGRLILSCNCVINGFLDTGFLQKGHYILQIMNKDRILTGIFLKY